MKAGGDKGAIIMVAVIVAAVLATIGSWLLASVVKGRVDAFVGEVISDLNIPQPIAEPLKGIGNALSATILTLVTGMILVLMVIISSKTIERSRHSW